jgi:hypothetical protein
MGHTKTVPSCFTAVLLALPMSMREARVEALSL